MPRMRALSLLAAGVLLFSGCTSTGEDSDPEPGDEQGAADLDPAVENPAQDPEDDGADGSGEAEQVAGATTAKDIVSTIEEMGFECAEQDRTLKMVSLGIECKADDYLFLTANQFLDPAERDSHYEERAIPLLCGELDMSQVHWSVRDDWLLVPGGERDKDFAAHDEASEKLGFEMSTHTCE